MEEAIASGSESKNDEDIVTIGEISYNKTIVLGESLATVYEGKFNSVKVAVKKQKVLNHNREDSEDNLMKLKECSNIVQLLHVESENSYRYYALELCDGSMDKLFLPDCYNTYNEMLPNNDQVLLELAEGLEYIHSKNIVHLDIKPQNVLFSITSSSDDIPLIFKWADFGHSKLVRDDGNVFISDTTGGRPGTLFWTAPEILDLGNSESNTSTSPSSDSDSSNDLEISVECDIWSAGCVFFYYITKGKHPFGDLDNANTSQISRNVVAGNPVNINELLPENHGFEMLILKMVKRDPESRATLKEIIEYLKLIRYILPIHAFKNPEEKKIRIMNRKYRLGFTTYSRNGDMFTQDHVNDDDLEDDFRVDFIRGIFGDDCREVAVKRIHHKRHSWDGFGEQKLRSLSLDEHHHENVLRLLHTEHHQFYEGIRYFAFELCAGSLDHLFLEENHPKKYRGPPLPSSDIVLTSLIQGLNYIHSNDLIHIRIKPQNVLISLTQPVVMKWADFGLFDVTIGMINSSNTKKWFAPEIIKRIDKKLSNHSRKLSYLTKSINKKAADVWSAGAVFYYYLTGGKHPSEDLEFTSWEHFPRDALNFLNAGGHFFARDVIAKMMTLNPEERIKLVPDAADQLECNWKSYNKALTRTFKEKEILILCSVSEPLERDVDRLCQLFNEEGIDLNCTSTEGDTPLSLLCSSLKESNEHFRSLSTLMLRIGMQLDAEGEKIQPKELEQLLKHLRAEHQDDGTRLHKLMRRAYRDPGWFLKDAVQFFADHIPDCLNAKDSSDRTILHWLCERFESDNLLDMIKLLKRLKIKMDIVDEDGFTALHLLCKNYRCDNLIDIIRELISDADLDLINAIDVNRKNILHHLCEKYQHPNLVNIVELLIKNGIDINAKDSNGETAVQHLLKIYPGDNAIYQVIQLFIDERCEFTEEFERNFQENPDRAELLDYSERHSNVKRRRLQSKNDEMIDQIIVRLNLRDDSGNSSPSKNLRHLLCSPKGRENAVQIIKECIESGYDFKVNNAVHDLCKFYKEENLLYILKAVITEGGVHVHIKGEDGNTFLHLICKYYYGDNIIDIIEMLVNDCKADPNARNDQQRTPLYFLCCCCRKIEDISIVGVIRRFTEIGAEPKIRDHNKMSTLHALCQSYKGANISEIVELLIKKGVDVNAKTTYGRTALGFLCENYPDEEELFKTVQLFMDRGFHMNAKNKVPNWINNETSILDCLNKNSKIVSKARITKLLLENINDD